MSLTFWTRSRTFAISLALGFCLALGITAAGFSQFSAGCAAVRADTLRLHIVAASDAVSDQTLKLKVRDAIVAAAGQLCANAADKAQAEAILCSHLPMLVHIAQYTMAQAGRPQQATARLENSYFATTQYSEDTLPAGRYDAIRIRLGRGAGHNWWCCLYPALCLSASGAHYEKPAEEAIVTGKYELRFAAVEWWEGRKEKQASGESEALSAAASTPQTQAQAGRGDTLSAAQGNTRGDTRGDTSSAGQGDTRSDTPSQNPSAAISASGRAAPCSTPSATLSAPRAAAAKQ